MLSHIPDLPSMLALLEVYIVFLAGGAAVFVIWRWWLRHLDPFNERKTRSIRSDFNATSLAGEQLRVERVFTSRS